MAILDSGSALIIADMINDFVKPEGKLYVPGIADTVKEVAALVREAHEVGAPVIFVNDAHAPDDDEFARWGEHAVAGSWGSEVVEELAPSESDHVLEKTRYSAWYKTGLDDLLAGKLGIRRVVITGTVTNICVFVSAIEALMRGYDVTVPRSAVKGLDEEDSNRALDQLQRVFGARVV